MSLNRKSIHRRRRRVLIKKIGLIGVLFIVLLWGLSYFSRHPKATIQNISIEGNRVIPTEAIKEITEEKLSGNYLFLFSKKNFLIYSERSLKKELLNKFKRIENILIEQIDRNTLVITLKERQGEYLLCNDTINCYFVDKLAYVFDKAPNFSGSVYFRIYLPSSDGNNLIGQNFMPAEEFTRLLDFKERVDGLFQVKALEMGENGDYKFLLDIEGDDLNPYIIFKKISDLNKVFDNLVLSVGAEPLSAELKDKISSLEYLDLRYDNKVLYKFK